MVLCLNEEGLILIRKMKTHFGPETLTKKQKFAGQKILNSIKLAFSVMQMNIDNMWMTGSLTGTVAS